MSAKKRGLGRGLDALLATSQSSDRQQQPESNPTQSELSKLPIEYLVPGKYQPRKDMSPEALEELASSIRSQGVIQPIVVRQLGEHRFEIIAGERRWRAAQLAQLDEVPCLVKNVPDEAAVAIALIENIQREDLNAMEEAQALDRLMIEFELTHQEVAEAVGKSRTTVTNLLRLNNLNDDVKLLVEHGDIEMGHARALLALDGEMQSEAAQTVSGKGLTVRDTEKLVRKLLEPAKPKPEKEIDPDVKNLMTRLSENLGAPVAIDHNAKGKGKMVINFGSLDELDGILEKLHLQE
ncbi:ParB/RepB/Spo0J family partition protein [Alteromonas sp. H39]|uniref:ParB/RepB/Spo0J family partition protein n=1 Tax=Alteromonas sp. H39 TaxID=3389876 RepID=UPI0039DFF4C3